MISFVVIGKNEGWRLEKCFKGIINFVKTEKIADYEVIYVDSRSDDNSIELSKSYGNTKTILITGECNAAIARNIGANEANGDILFFLDGDMELVPGFYSSIVKDSKLNYPFISGLEMDIMHDGNWNYVESIIHRKFIEGKDSFEVTTGGLFIIDRISWKKLGGMDNRLRRSQDLDFGFRMTKMGCKLCRKPQVWVNHYTRAYLSRPDIGKFDKYKALLLRKNIFNFTAMKFLMGVNYTVLSLLIFCLAAISFKSLYPLLLYFVIVGYRTFKEYKRYGKMINPMYNYIWQIKSDINFVYYLITYWPDNIELKYEIK